MDEKRICTNAYNISACPIVLIIDNKTKKIILKITGYTDTIESD